MELSNGEKSESTFDNDLNKASRSNRLWASLIDGAIMMVFILPVLYYTGGLDDLSLNVKPSFVYSMLMALFGILLFVLINGRLLAEKGQTIGKRAMGIKIVTLRGELPDVSEHLLKRYGFYFLIGYIPFIGQTLSLINVLIIFGDERRCGHDYVANTTVVNI